MNKDMGSQRHASQWCSLFLERTDTIQGQVKVLQWKRTTKYLRLKLSQFINDVYFYNGQQYEKLTERLEDCLKSYVAYLNSGKNIAKSW